MSKITRIVHKQRSERELFEKLVQEKEKMFDRMAYITNMLEFETDERKILELKDEAKTILIKQQFVRELEIKEVEEEIPPC